MTEPTGPVERQSRTRRVDSRPGAAASGRDGGAFQETLPVRFGSGPDEPAPPKGADAAAYAAHLLGQGEQRRGLRGGPETLGRARSTYLETEWSGGADRRLSLGRIAKTEI